MFKRVSVNIKSQLKKGQELRVVKQVVLEKKSNPAKVETANFPINWQGNRIPLTNMHEDLFIYLPHGVMCSLLVQTIQDVTLGYNANDHCWVVSIRQSKGNGVTSPGDVNLTIVPPEGDDL